MFFVKILIPLGTVLVVAFIIQRLFKAFKKADVEGKIEEIEEQEQLYKQTTAIDVEEVKHEKKHLDKLKKLDV